MVALPTPAGPALPAADPGNSEPALTGLDPRQLKLLRLQASLFAGALVLGSLVLEIAGFAPRGLWVAPTGLLAAALIFVAPLRRYRSTGYAVAFNRLRIVRGVIVRKDTTVPFGRVQHIDVQQGPLQRLYGLSTLTLHTAGTHNASVNLGGLAHDDAVALRDMIRAHIGRETE